MSEETVLKSSIFGGYKKEEVDQYVDSVVEENDKRLNELQEQILYLTNVNDQLKNQLNAEKKTRPKISDKSGKPEYYAHETKQAAPIAPVDLSDSNNQEKLQVRQQMKLPEGIYIVSEDHSIVSLPEPMPLYRAKGKNTISNAMPQTKKSAAQEGTSTFHENVPETAEQTEKNGIIENGSKEKSANRIDMKDAETAVDVRKISRKESAPIQQNQTSGEYSVKQYAPEIRHPSQKSCLSEDITKLQNELLSVKVLLEEERHEKQMLAAKLEFSNDLLIKLYQK